MSSNATLIQPDFAFTDSIIASGGEDLRKCFQCATCSSVCELSPAEAPFPRKEILWAQWGMKDRLLSDPDAWLCHNCGDCSLRCPRTASPGNVLGAIRREVILHYAVPGFLANWVNQPIFLPVLMLIPALLLALALLIRDPLGSALGFEAHHGTGMEYANLFPHWLLIGFFTLFLTISVVIALAGAVAFWKAMDSADRAEGKTIVKKPFIRSCVQVINDILFHKHFSSCATDKTKRKAHFSSFYGFLILFLVSGWAVILLYFINPFATQPLEYPFSFWNPAKVVANIGALALVVGCLIAIVDRLRRDKAIGHTTDFDWMFLSILLAVGLTGIFVEALRYLEVVSTGYFVYFIHLILAFMLLIYLPYSKFAHIVYRTAALLYAKCTGRDEIGASQVTGQEEVT